jgi:hypothetical protein
MLRTLLLALLAGCTAAQTNDTADTSAPSADLTGTWASACYATTQTTFTYTDTEFVGTYDEYTDDTCTTAYHHSEWTGTYAVGHTDAEGVTPIDLAFLTFTSTALTEDNAAQNNAYAYCGFTDWEVDVERDILGADCYGFSIPVGGKSLDIYRIDEDALMFGKGAQITTEPDESSRPTVIDETRVFSRQ